MNTAMSVEIGGRALNLTNLDKPLFSGGFTKGQLIDYYARIAPVMLPYLAGRPTTFKRYPNGVDGQTFYNKNVPAGSPDWLNRVKVKDNVYPVIDEPAALVYAAQLAAIELHVPPHRVLEVPPGGPTPAWPGQPLWHPDAIVFDLDPGPGTGISECSTVALAIRELVEPLGLAAVIKTSGSKGMQMYLRPVPGTEFDGPTGSVAFARAVAEGLEKTRPDNVVAKMTKDLRPGKIFIDWSQNVAAKTTVCAYSVRARVEPWVSTPLTWDEVDEAASGRAELRFVTDDVLSRIDSHGDLLRFAE